MTKFRRGRVAATRAVLPIFVSCFTLACGAADEESTDEHETVASEATAIGGLQVPRLFWQPCGADFPDAECTLASVPLDYDEPRRSKTKLALAKIPATGEKIGTVFVNPGGPGASGVGLVLSGFGAALAELLGGRFDVVGFDPRGVGGSEPLYCFESGEERDAFVSATPLFPYLREQERPFFDAGRELAERCLLRGRRMAAHMSTADVVRDLDLLRQAVGDRRLTYLGFSYGSYIGNTYANLFPDKVRALVIDGVLDPRLWSSGWQIVSDRVASEEVFGEFMRLCDEAAEDCALHAEGGALARYDALASAIKATPFVFEDGFVYSYDFLLYDTVSALYAPEWWGGPEGYAAFFAFLAEASLGDADAAREASRVRAVIQKRLERHAPNQEPYDNWFDAYYGNQCADTDYPASFFEFRAIGRYAETNSRFGPSWWWYNAPCASWPSSPDRHTGPWTAKTAAPVLVVGNYFDPATDYAGARASDALLQNSRLLSYAGWGHTAFGRSECVTHHVVSYLVEGVLPPRDTVCPANPNPFLPVMIARSIGSQSATFVSVPPLRPLQR